MTDANAANTNWIDAWLETQRGWLARWHSVSQSLSMEQRADAMRNGMETLRAHFDPQAMTPQALDLAQGFQQLLHTSLHAMGEWFRMSAEAGAAAGSFDPLSLPPLGPAREQQLLWQDLLRNQHEYQRCLQALLGAYAKVFAESLDAVPEQVARRNENGQPVSSLRDLYDLWIECGETAFARMARDEAFIVIQAECGNAQSRLKVAQGALLEHWLKALDLPTRSELNSVHLRLRELQARVDALTHERDGVTQQDSVASASKRKGRGKGSA